jgi:hypothetical protein
MITFRSSTVVMAHGGTPAVSSPGGRASSPRTLRSRSTVTPACVTTATGPDAAGSPARNPASCLPAVMTPRPQAPVPIVHRPGPHIQERVQ